MVDLNYLRFRRFVEELAREERTSAEMVLEPLGLMVQPDGGNFDYWCTPVNSVTFAATGGDGVHFGLLDADTLPTTPVVMTVPMTDAPNLVLADDFHGFLRLGYHAGFFFLEQFVYDWDDAVLIHGREGDGWGDRERRLLARLRAEFGLEPVADVSAQIRGAHDAHARQLRLPDQEAWNRRHPG